MSRQAPSTDQEKPTVIGIYGVPGSGKTFLLHKLKAELGETDYNFYEGSQVIDSLVPGGLDIFKQMPEFGKKHWREKAINMIRDTASKTRRTAIVTGHHMFFNQGDAAVDITMTNADHAVYTHIFYLDVPAQVVYQQRQSDPNRFRKRDDIQHITQHQRLERINLQSACLTNGIHYAQYALNGITCDLPKLETVLVLDGDKTLADADTGDIFWGLCVPHHPLDEDLTLKDVFSSRQFGYSYKAFRQAMLLYEQAHDDDAHDALCERVAEQITLRVDMLSLLWKASKQEHVMAVVFTSGLKRVWEKILIRAGLPNVKVIGGNRIKDGYVVTGDVKGALVSHLKDNRNLHVVAFGDSPLDLLMLRNADEAIVVVGDEKTRSKSMEEELATAIDSGLQARQLLFPPSATPRLDTQRLPIIHLDEEGIAKLLRRRSPRSSVKPQAQLALHHATDSPAAKILMAPMRNASISGPALRLAHRNVGNYLALTYISTILGLEEYDMKHVQGSTTTGHRLANESTTLIIALMRGGEPMAQGVGDAFPLSPFLHAKDARDVKTAHLKDTNAVILVESVVNSGKSVLEFVRRIRQLSALIPIVVVAGVVQEEATKSDSGAGKELVEALDVSLVALRVSENKFTGTKGTDTGDRLFNTTFLV
ncbi:hypothetical protein MBLNU457_6302t1 [Dothideomycetes sp. NU457]